MDLLQQARELREAGLFRDALECVERSASETIDKTSAQVLHAEMLERVGRPTEARAIIKRLLPSKALTWSDRSSCDFALARIAIEQRDFDAAIAHLTRSIANAQRAGDLDKTCAGQLKLLLLLADGAGTDTTGPLSSEVRTNAVRSGNPRTLAAVHVYFAQIEGLRSAVSSSRRHLRLARQLLDTAPNTWLEAVSANVELSLALMESEFETAKQVAEKGFESCQRSGSNLEIAVNRSNAGYAFQILGEFEQAETCYERAIELFVNGSEAYNGTVDSLARVRLSQNRMEECERLLDEIDAQTVRRQRPTYVHRHLQFTRAELFLRKGELDKGERQLDAVLRMSREANDPILTASALIEQAKLYLRTGKLMKAETIIRDLSTSLRAHSADVYARYQEVLALAEQTHGQARMSRPYISRAERIYTGLHHRQALISLRESYSLAPQQTEHCETIPDAVADVLQSVSAILSYGRHPELVAFELQHILAATRCFDRLVVSAQYADASEQILQSVKDFSTENTAETIHTLTIGQSSNRTIELSVRPRQGLQSLPILHSLTTLIDKTNEIETARVARSQRLTPWPVDDLPMKSGNFIISGQMSAVMRTAQQVARSTAIVLITGESGTGKEIVARAIHDFSNRAHKPFVPFNCSAVPRDLLESQLFGHRRGAFTGAERDQLGLIRSAADGTLFLDEIGDMSLDLQPKLLRFLESGEIAPLGEPSPFTVNVRVVAATNANLEDLVRDGKFREDLFYRINVVRLSLKPLRERRDEIPGMVNHFLAIAAREHQKGHLQVSEDTMERLLLYRWPGNVRQLQNEVRRLVALAEPNSTIEPDAISASILGAMPDLRHTGINGREIAIPLHDKLLPTLSRIEYEMIKAALREHHGRLEPAAKSLGISRKGLYLKRQRLGL